MTAIEWLVWGSLIVLVFWLYQAVDIARPLSRFFHRRKPAPPRVPHWARNGHLPLPPKHGRHHR